MIAPYSTLRKTERPALAPLLPLALPFSVWIEPTSRCNFKCLFCPQSFGDYEDKIGGYADMDFALYEKIVSEIKGLGRLKAIKFYGIGEPMLYSRLADMVGLAVREGITDRTEITSNGSALTEAKGKQLIASGLDYLRISIYAGNQAHHQTITQSKISLNRIVDNLKSFRKIRDEMESMRPFLYVKMIDTFDEAENEEFRQMFYDIADEIMIEKPMNWSSFEKRDILSPIYGGSKPSEETLFPFRKQVCPIAFYSMVILANGDVVACCVDWSKKTLIGNLKNETFGEVWHGNKMQSFRRMQLEERRSENEACKNCTYLFTNPDNLEGLSSMEKERILA